MPRYFPRVLSAIVILAFAARGCNANDTSEKIKIPNGRCDRVWLPYMDLSPAASSTARQPAVIDLKNLASSTDTHARTDFVRTTLSANANINNLNTRLIERLNTEKIKVQKLIILFLKNLN